MKYKTFSCPLDAHVFASCARLVGYDCALVHLTDGLCEVRYWFTDVL